MPAGARVQVIEIQPIHDSLDLICDALDGSISDFGRSKVSMFFGQVRMSSQKGLEWSRRLIEN